MIPSWNGIELLDVVLPSLERQTYRSFHVTVVDNGSHDGSVTYLRRSWPQVNVIALPRNVGFAPAVNVGVRASRTELVALLNNDLELEPVWLEEMVAELRAHPEAGSAAGKMLDYSVREVIDDCGDGLSWYGVGFARGRGERDRGQYDEPGTVFSACAGAATYRRSALEDVGLMDEDFFAYMEDLDWGFRAQLAGYACRYQPRAVSYHVGGATSAKAGDFVSYRTFRNGLLLIAKDFPLPAIARHAHRILVLVAATLAMSLIGRSSGDPAVRANALRTAAATLRKRRRVQRLRRVSLAHLDSVVTDHFPVESRLFNFVDERIFRSGPRGRPRYRGRP